MVDDKVYWIPSVSGQDIAVGADGQAVREEVSEMASSDAEKLDDYECTFENLANLVNEALATDDAHHMQWYLQRMAEILGVYSDDYDAGIAP